MTIVKPTFIVGVPRSGTTLLVNLLGGHPLLAPIYETKFLRNLFFLCDRICWFQSQSIGRRLAAIFGEPIIQSRFVKECDRFRRKAIAYNKVPPEKNGTKQSYESFPFGETLCIHYSLEDVVRETHEWLEIVKRRPANSATIWDSARDYVNRLFAIHCARMGKPYWINKTPGFLNHLDGLSKLYPDARYIHMLRDGRDVAVSNLSLPWGPATVRQAARRWKELISTGQKCIKVRNLALIDVRYEDLIESPVNVLTRIFNFLAIDADSEKLLSLMPIFRARTGVWRTAFTAEHREIFAREAGALLIELGYEKNYDWVR
jgi:hypothetical protein